MNRYWIITLVCVTMLCLGCAESRKIHMPLAEIDRPLVDPKGTWSVKPSIGTYIDAMDTTTYRGIQPTNLLLPPSAYSLTNNLSLSFSSFLSPSFAWQLTKSPLIDSTERYKWQFAIAGNISGGMKQGYMNLSLDFKKRLGASVWSTAAITSGWFYHSREGVWVKSGSVSDGIGFQLSPKADVKSSLGFSYYDSDYHVVTMKNVSGSGYFNFHYTFSPWFSLNIGSGIYVLQSNSTEMSTSIGSEFYW
jgi:hypothetical protein